MNNVIEDNYKKYEKLFNLKAMIHQTLACRDKHEITENSADYLMVNIMYYDEVCKSYQKNWCNGFDIHSYMQSVRALMSHGQNKHRALIYNVCYSLNSVCKRFVAAPSNEQLHF